MYIIFSYYNLVTYIVKITGLQIQINLFLNKEGSQFQLN